MSTALITGASQGLGEEFCSLLAADHLNLVLVARNREKLEVLSRTLSTKYGISVTVLPHDLSQEDAVRLLVSELHKRGIVIDILVNNAGFGAYGKFHETTYEHEKSLIDVNIAALTELTKELLPGMVKRGNGKILNVASTAAFQPGPLMAVYYASKSYVMNFSLALSRETRGTGVTVTCLCPGPTRTGFQQNASMMKSRLFLMHVMDAKTVAKIGTRAMMKGKPLVVAGFINALGAFMTRFVSRLFAAKIAEKAQSPL